MKLYYSPNASSLAVHIVLRESGIPFKMERVNLERKKTEGGVDFYHVNPKGNVPVLELSNDHIITEVPAILHYLCECAPKSSLTSLSRKIVPYRLQEWLNFISTEMHKSFTPLLNESPSNEVKKAAMEHLKKQLNYVNATLEKHHFLLGECYSAADAYLFTVLRWGDLIKMDFSPWPAIEQFMQRVGSRPAVKTALHAEEVGK